MTSRRPWQTSPIASGNLEGGHLGIAGNYPASEGPQKKHSADARMLLSVTKRRLDIDGKESQHPISKFGKRDAHGQAPSMCESVGLDPLASPTFDRVNCLDAAHARRRFCDRVAGDKSFFPRERLHPLSSAGLLVLTVVRVRRRTTRFRYLFRP
jgi:hypothetical protein